MEIIHNKKLLERYQQSNYYQQLLPKEVDPFCQLVCYDLGQLIIRQHEPTDALYLMMDGRCSISEVLPNGSLMIQSTYQAPCLIGEIELLEQKEAAMNVKALSDCILIRLPFETTRQILIQNNAFLQKMCIGIIQKERNNAIKLAQAYAYPVLNRLAFFILNNRMGITFQIKKVDIASSLGVSYRHLEKLMSDLVKEGTLSKQKLTYCIEDEKRLEELSKDLSQNAFA